MPEVVARNELLADPRYVVNQGGQAGCKLPCPSCGTNEFVLLGKVNVKAEKSVRFAFGNGRVMVPISRCYHCVNPACAAVQAKPRRKDAALELKLLQGARCCLHHSPVSHPPFCAQYPNGSLVLRVQSTRAMASSAHLPRTSGRT